MSNFLAVLYIDSGMYNGLLGATLKVEQFAFYYFMSLEVGYSCDDVIWYNSECPKRTMVCSGCGGICLDVAVGLVALSTQVESDGAG